MKQIFCFDQRQIRIMKSILWFGGRKREKKRINLSERRIWPVMFILEKLALIPGLCWKPCLQQLLTLANCTAWKWVHKI